MVQTSLFQFMSGSRKRPVEDSDVEAKSDSESLPGTPVKRKKADDSTDGLSSASKKVVRKVNSNWLTEFDWLAHEPNSDEIMAMFCTLCRNDKIMRLQLEATSKTVLLTGMLHSNVMLGVPQ